MKALWTLLKIVIGLALVIPLSIIVLATAVGVLGALVAIAILVLKLAVFGLIGWGVFRLITRLVGGSANEKRRAAISAPPPADPHYEAAMRELDRDLGEVPR